MQKAANKAAAAAAASKLPPSSAAAAAAAGISSPEAGLRAADRQRGAELQRLAAAGALPAENRQDNEQLASSMTQLMSGMKQYQYEVYRNPEVDKVYSLKRQTKEDKAAQLVGRLATPVFKALMDEHARATQQGRQLAAADLARQYGADPAVLEQVLRHNAVPTVRSETDGRLVGSWPKKQQPKGEED